MIKTDKIHYSQEVLYLNKINIKCPCCNKDIDLLLDDGKYTIVFFDDKVSDTEVFDQCGICFGAKGGDDYAK